MNIANVPGNTIKKGMLTFNLYIKLYHGTCKRDSAVKLLKEGIDTKH